MGQRGMWDEGRESLCFKLVLGLVSAVQWSRLSVHTHMADFCWDVVSLDLAHGIHYWSLWPRGQWAVCCLGFVRVQWQSFCWDGSILEFSDVISSHLQEHTSPPRTDWFLLGPFLRKSTWRPFSVPDPTLAGPLVVLSAAFCTSHLKCAGTGAPSPCYRSQEHAPDLFGALLPWCTMASLNNYLLWGFQMGIKNTFLPLTLPSP